MKCFLECSENSCTNFGINPDIFYHCKHIAVQGVEEG